MGYWKVKFDYKKDIHPKYLLLVLSVICIGLFVLSAFTDTLRPVKRGTAKIIMPMQEGIDKIAGWVDEKLEKRRENDDLRAENEALKKELEDKEQALLRNQTELSELSDLRSLYKLDQLYPDYNKTAARVVMTDPSGWYNEFYIDKGLNDGVYEDCNVLYGNGLLGIVTESYDDYAKVRAIIDDHSHITAEIGEVGTVCTVEGSLRNMDDGYLMAVDINASAGVKAGDKVVTSRVSDRYHYGLMIGYVESVTPDSNNLTATARISPAASFRDVTEVLVIIDRKQEVTY